jgi:hypothetical protein
MDMERMDLRPYAPQEALVKRGFSPALTKIRSFSAGYFRAGPGPVKKGFRA